MSMHKRRARSVYLNCFAALIMVAQLVIAGGHVHLATSAGNPPQVWPVTLSKDGGQLPAPGKSRSGHDHFCPLCWAQAAASSLLAPDGAQLRIPAIVIRTQTIAHFDEIATFAVPSSFNPRGPPCSTSLLAQA
jgi:hypothetical protein